MGTLHVSIIGIFIAAFIASIDTTRTSDCILRSCPTEVAKRIPSGQREVGDAGDSSPEDRSDAYKLNGKRWEKSHITYKIIKYTRQLSNRVVDDAIRRAFKIWTDVTNLTVEQIPSGSSKKSDIEIEFVPEIEELVIGRSGGPYCPDPIKLSEEADWTVDAGRGDNLRETAAHEIGHAFGLSHSDDRRALMCPDRRRGDPNFTLGSDDINGIQYLYGAPGGKPSSYNGPSRNGSSGYGVSSKGRGVHSRGGGWFPWGRRATSGRIQKFSSSSSSSSSSNKPSPNKSSSDSSSSDSPPPKGSSSSVSSFDSTSSDSSSSDSS